MFRPSRSVRDLSSASRSDRTLTLGQKGIVHGSAIALGNQGALFIGPAGSGKSAMCLDLMARGAVLVSDDRVRLDSKDDAIVLSPAPSIAGLIEARGVGILACNWTPAILGLVVDLGITEEERLPKHRDIWVGHCKIPLLHKVASSHFPAAIMQYMIGGRTA